jgi:hypothetical protein
MKPTPPAHAVEIRCERGQSMPGTGHRAHCTCGWSSDCYAQLTDTERAIEVHLRRSQRQDFDDLIARSSIGAAIADIKERGLDAHLADLERESRPRRRARSPR